MGKIRDAMNKNPWIGSTIAVVLLVGAAAYWFFGRGSGGTYSRERMSEMVVIRDSETGDTWEMRRAELELALRERSGAIDPKQGIVNPKTGKATGFPVDRQWTETVKRLNEERELTIKERQQQKPPPPK
ncbi:MAG: hypothetical protein H7Y88_01615 [Phycisphaerales bacterium]|nr:hypothetical protein [Phycisphaerales bacterium]